MKKRLMFFAALAVAAITVVAGTAIAGTPVKSGVVYNSIVPNGPPSNLPSVGFEATSTSEFGAAVTLTGSARNLTSVTVGMSSWACVTGSADGTGGACSTPKGATFSHPITLTLYNVSTDGSTLGSPIASVTQTFDIPYRPSSSPKCASDPDRPFGWYSPGLKACFNGMTDNVTFNFSGVTLPATVVYGIAFNTTDYGAVPTHVVGPYDSLNVALSTNGESGTENDATAGSTGPIWLNSLWSGAYADNGANGTGTFRADTGSWSPYQPAVQFKASNSG
jgi:hypothetical protein